MKKFLYNYSRACLIPLVKLVLIIFLFHINNSYSQDKWTLSDCIEYASKNHNLIQQQLLYRQQSLLELDAAKKSIFPELSATIKANNNWCLYVDPVSNLLTRQRNIATNTVINLNMTLFSGMKNLYTINLKQQSVASADAGKEKELRQLKSDIINAYYNVLLAKEQLSNAHKMKQEIEKEKTFIEGRVESGIAHKRDLLSMEYQLSTIILAETEASNLLQTALSDLKLATGISQAEQIDVDDNIDQDQIEIFQLNLNLVDSIASACSPEIQKAKLELEMAKSSMMIAKSARYPTLSLYGNAGTKTSTKKSETFNTQLNENQNQVLGLLLTIPIYSNNRISNSISSAELDVRIKQLNMQIISEAFRNELKKAFLALNSSYGKVQSAQKQYIAANEEFKYSQKLFEIGNISTFEYSEIRSRMINAQSVLLLAKYDFISRKKSLDLYLGKI